MIEKIRLLEIINEALSGSDKFLVNLKVTPDNRIYVDIDGDNGVTIDDCIALSRTIEGQLNRDEEDFALDVSSAGIDQPLKFRRQYAKNLGRDVEVLMADGEKLTGTLTAANEDAFSIHIAGTKKQAPRDEQLRYSDVKSVRVAIKF